MNRIVSIDIGGKSFEMCFTLWAFGQVCERYESLPKCLAELDRLVGEGSTMAAMDEYLWILSVLLKAQWHRDNLKKVTLPPLPDEDALHDLICPGEFLDLQRKVLDCIALGNSRTVGVDDSKNGDGAGTGAGPALES